MHIACYTYVKLTQLAIFVFENIRRNKEYVYNFSCNGSGIKRDGGVVKQMLSKAFGDIFMCASRVGTMGREESDDKRTGRPYTSLSDGNVTKILPGKYTYMFKLDEH